MMIMVRKSRLPMPSHQPYSWPFEQSSGTERYHACSDINKISFDSHCPLVHVLIPLSPCLPTAGGRMLCSAEFVHSWIYVITPLEHLKSFDSSKLYSISLFVEYVLPKRAHLFPFFHHDWNAFTFRKHGICLL